MSTDRRTLVRAAAWTAPTIAVAAAAPTVSASTVGTLSPISFTFSANSGTGQFALSPPLTTGPWQLGWVTVATDTLTLTVSAVGPVSGTAGAVGFFTCAGAVPAGTNLLATVLIPGYAPLSVTTIAD